MLIQAREAFGKSPKEMAVSLNVPETTYLNAERGHYGATVVQAMARKLPNEQAEALREAYKNPSERDAALHPENQEVLLPPQLLEGLATARVTRFHPSRAYYGLYREGRASISDYVSLATSSLEMVSLALATGIELERVMDTFEQMLQRPGPVRITVSILDCDRTYLMESIAHVVGASPETLRGRIMDSINTLSDFAERRLSNVQKERFQLWAHASLPNASAILIDGDLNFGRIQLETKGYKMGMGKSFGFEVSAPSEFFDDLRGSYRHLISDGRRIL